MNDIAKKFQIDSAKAAHDENRYQVLQHNINTYHDLLQSNHEIMPFLSTLRTRAEYIKENVINNLEEYLKDFEKAFSLNGGKIIWANDAATACRSIEKILTERNITSIIATQSLEAEEIEIAQHLRQQNIEVTHSHIGNFINEVIGEKRSNIAHAAFHHSFEEMAQLFHQKFDTPEDISPEQLMDFIRSHIRPHFQTAEASITGVDFLIAENGAIVLNGEEGDQLMASALPKVHIAIAGIERVIPTIKDLEIFRLLSEYYKYGREFPVYENIITSPQKSNENNGVKELFLVILNNGRHQILNRINQRKALYCIKCGACFSVCPVYKSIGGQCYDSIYSGPIGTVITPLMKGIKTYQHLCYACTLCGRCSEICPMKIPIPDLIIYNRYYINKLNAVPQPLKRRSAFLFNFQKSRKKMNRNKNIKNYFLRKIWNTTSDSFSDKTFHQIHEEGIE
ncbi:MAG: LUD domain-containing protein [Bacteroidales bacterium]|nr:LUD domain-containing protein [Bacteroidales bacterium]